MFGGLDEDAVILMPNLDSVFKIPERIATSSLMPILERITANTKKPDLTKWHELVAKQTHTPSRKVTIGLVAKYMDNEDTYISVLEALKAAGWDLGVKLEIRWISAEKATEADFAGVDGLLVPGGFGTRGIEGKIAAARYALDHNVAYLGICLGLQVAVIAAARKAGLVDANSTEFDSATEHDVVYIMEGQQGKESTGGTLRLGDYPAQLTKGTVTHELYGTDNIVERHRHRYEVNQQYLKEIADGGLRVSGTSPDGKLVEFVEAEGLRFFVATQAHPEFRSRPTRPHPLFEGLIRAAMHR
jgi:CTP synthase